MTDGDNPGRSIASFTPVVVLLIIAACILIAYFTANYLGAICLGVLGIGIYLTLSSLARSKQPDRWGTSDAGAALLWGFFFMSIGAGGMVYAFTHNIVFAIVTFIVMLALYLLARGH